jgi:carboxylesterase type B
LGILGAFSSGDEVASGNWQLKDQALAINWVHQHISSFGGDPSKISLLGQSAGAVSAHLQMMSPLAKDKLNTVISISGCAFNFWGLNTLERGARLSRANSRLARCPTTGRGSNVEQSRAMLECMQEVPAEWLVANQLFSVGWGFPVPMIEPSVPGAFLTESPDSAYVNGNVAKIPWIATVTSEESNTVIAEVAARGGVPWLNRFFDADAPLLLGFNGRVQASEESQIVNKIRSFYGAGPRRSSIPRQFFTQVANARFFTVPFHKGVQMHSQIAPTYAGIFNYTNYVGTPGRLGLDPKQYGVTHTDDLIFILNSTSHAPISRTEEAFAITKLIVNVYSNFAENR